MKSELVTCRGLPRRNALWLTVGMINHKIFCFCARGSMPRVQFQRGLLRRHKKSGGVLLSHDLAAIVSSALKGLTSVFGMGTGVAPSASPPETDCYVTLP